MNLLSRKVSSVRAKDICSSRSLLIIPWRAKLESAAKICENLGGQLASDAYLDDFFSWDQQKPTLWTAFRANITGKYYYNMYTREKVNLAGLVQTPLFEYECVYCDENIGCGEASCTWTMNPLCDLDTTVTFTLSDLEQTSNFRMRYKPTERRGKLTWVGHNTRITYSDTANGWIGSSIFVEQNPRLFVNASETSLMIGNLLHYKYDS